MTVKLYVTFWDDLHQMFCDCIHLCFLEGQMTAEQRRGVISLIPNKGTDRRYVKSWRLITLLNTDYKIVTKAFALRLQSCISSIVHIDQNGVLRGRYIGSNIQDIIDHVKNSETAQDNPFLLSLD